jgi:protein-S-isoprenylcysteine O-methyltransferase Ste14
MLARVGYGALFIAVLPTLLVLWARATPWITAPIPAEAWHRTAAWGALVTGGALMLSGMAALWFRGGGLPMNAFPPPRRVVDNVYALHRHPIYLGAGLFALGVAVLSRSASALYLVVPTFVLAAVTLVLGFEGIDLARRFGPPHPVFLEWPRVTTPDAAPSRLQRAQFYAVVLLPWLFGYGVFAVLGRPPGAVSLRSSIEETWPVLPWTEPVYASLYWQSSQHLGGLAPNVICAFFV